MRLIRLSKGKAKPPAAPADISQPDPVMTYFSLGLLVVYLGMAALAVG